MDITAFDGGFAVSMMAGEMFHFNWDKKTKELLVWENPKAKYKLPAVNVMTNRGDFIEAANDAGEVISQGGDGEFFYVPISKEPTRLRFRKLPKPSLSKSEFDKARKKVTRYVYSDSPYGLGLNDKLSKAISILEEKLSAIPKEYRDTAQIEFSNRMEYGETYENVEITYESPETDDELMRRLTIEAERSRIALDRKRAKLAKLKAELEPLED